MFGIGIGELLVILLVAFLIAPEQIPKMMRKIGRFFHAMQNLKKEVLQLDEPVKNDVKKKKLPPKSHPKRH